MTEKSKNKIAIIGAGITGLVAAYRLSKEGHKVTVFEKSGSIGGLAGGFKIHGTNLEQAYHHLFKTDTDIINLVNELDLTDKLKWYPSSVATIFHRKIYPFGGAIDLINFKPLSSINRIRTGFIIFYLQKTKNWKKFENISAKDWLIKNGGKQAWEIIWKPLLTGKFHKFAEQVSMAWLWARIHVRANSRQFGETEMLGYFAPQQDGTNNGGFNIFIEKLKEKLQENNVEILTNTSINSIEILQNEYDRIICTTPSYVFGKLIESKTNNDLEKYIEKLNSINYLGAVCLIFSSKQRLSDFYWHNVNDLDLPFLVFINHTSLINKSEYEDNYIYYIAGYYPHDHKYFEVDDDEIYKEWFESLKKIFPDFDLEKILERHLFRFKNAQHVADTHYKEKIPDYKTPIKNVYLANFSQIYPHDRGTNYAVREGNKIADLIFKQ